MKDKENERGERGALELSQQETKRVVRNTCGEGEKKSKNGQKSNGEVLRTCSEDIMKVSYPLCSDH